jgi:hypothetical protein
MRREKEQEINILNEFDVRARITQSKVILLKKHFNSYMWGLCVCV